jgi:hypothetical protein
MTDVFLASNYTLTIVPFRSCVIYTSAAGTAEGWMTELSDKKSLS